MLVSYNFLDDLLGYTSEPGSGPSNSTLRALNDTMENLDSNSTLIGDEQLDTEAVSRHLTYKNTCFKLQGQVNIF